MFCPKCGKQLSDDARFCGGCGSPVQQSVKTPQMVPPNRPAPNPVSAPAPGSAGKKQNSALIIILAVVLAVLILAAAGAGICYFVFFNDRDGGPAAERIEELEEEEDAEEDIEETDIEESDVEEADIEDEDVEEETEPVQEEEPTGVVSDTNEVVKDMILENIPKAVYSYDFNEDLGKAEVVVRQAGDTEPEETDDIEPQYVHGIDGSAVYLDGTYGIKLDDVERVGTSYTVAFWMKADRICDWSPFIHIGHDSLDPNNRVRLWISQKTDGASVAPIISSENVKTQDSCEIRPGKNVPNSIKTGVWYQIVFTVDASQQGGRKGSVLGTLYVAGQRVGAGEIIPDTMNVDDFDVFLGINCWDELYEVAFDEVKIWDQVLDEGQIQELYQAYE